MERITARSNPLLTHIRRLAADRGYRHECGEYLADSPKLLQEALLWDAELVNVVCGDGMELPPLPAGVRAVQVPADVMASVSPMRAPQGVLFTCRIPTLPLPEKLTGRRYAVLEGVQDPGNVGTVLRTLDAFDADGLFLLPGCADIYSPKTLRASMGAGFRRPARPGSCARFCTGAIFPSTAPHYGMTRWTPGVWSFPAAPWPSAARAGGFRRNFYLCATVPCAFPCPVGASRSTPLWPPPCCCGRRTAVKRGSSPCPRLNIGYGSPRGRA